MSSRNIKLQDFSNYSTVPHRSDPRLAMDGREDTSFANSRNRHDKRANEPGGGRNVEKTAFPSKTLKSIFRCWPLGNGLHCAWRGKSVDNNTQRS